jgi:fumarylacetoacetase
MTSGVPGAAGSDFNVDNLPLGVFAPPAERPRPSVAIGDSVADLNSLRQAGLIDEPAFAGVRVLSGFLACGRARWSALRAWIVSLDAVIMRGRARAGERRIGFGEVRGTIAG